jgi:uncharacterized protein
VTQKPSDLALPSSPRSSELPSASLYRGHVMHARFQPKAHRFDYHVFSVFLDLSELNTIDAISPIFSVDRLNLLSFYQKDHTQTGEASLYDEAQKLFHQSGIDLEGGKIYLLCYPRILGYVFDPLSVYFGYGPDGIIRGVVYEVRNTFGGRHCYVLPVTADDAAQSLIRQEQDKDFYVSPFNPMTMRYLFRLNIPGDSVKIRILLKENENPIMAAAFAGRHEAFSSSNLWSCFLTIPFLTIKIIAGIHFEALRLWMKGLKIVPRPHPR